LYSDQVGNPQLPKKFQALKKHSARMRWAMAMATLLGVAAIIAVFVFFLGRPVRPPSAVPDRSIAVLPFKNLSANQENAFFTDGVQDEILANLAKVADLKVISRTSVLLYKSGEPRNLREIGQQLGVAHVLEGSVQRAVNPFRVTAQLVDARTDAHLWAETYDRDLADVFAIQSDIAVQIADQLQAKLSPKVKSAIEERPTKDLAAYDLFVRGKFLITITDDKKLHEAARLLDQATARDPQFFLAYCGLAKIHGILYSIYDHTQAQRDLADAAVKAVIRLRPEAGEAHLARAEYLYRCYLDYDNARAELALAERSLPNNAQVFELMGHIDDRQGRGSEAARSMEKAVVLDPRNLQLLEQLSFIYQILRRFAEAAAVLDRAVALFPQDIGARILRAWFALDWR